MIERLRVGVVGCGVIAHLVELRDRYELNMLRGALGESDVVHHARLGRTVREIVQGQ